MKPHPAAPAPLHREPLGLLSHHLYRRSTPLLSTLTLAVFFLWAFLDLTGRLAPIHWLRILPEIEASRRPGRFHPFDPNLTIRNEHWVGESAVTANLVPAEFRSPVSFRTDELGFRLTPNLDVSNDIDLVFYEGASFIYGGSLSDDETLPSALTRLGIRTYNAAHPWWVPLRIDSLDWLLDRLGRGRRAVGVLCWEDADFWPEPRDELPSFLQGSAPQLAGSYRDLLASFRAARTYSTARLRISPLEVLSIRALKSISNDQWLPNHYKSSAEIRFLPNGNRFLFSQTEVDRASHPPTGPAFTRNVTYLSQLSTHLAARNLETFVILLPNRYSLYAPYLTPNTLAAPSDYLTRLESALNRLHIPVFNAAPVLAAQAPSDIAGGRLSFYREDHHWTPLGVQRVAEGFAAFLATHPSKGGTGSHALQ